MNIKKTILIFLAVILLAFIGIGGYVYVNASRLAEEIVREHFINSYNSNPETKYTINLKEIKLNILTGSVDLIDLSIQPKDSLVTFKRDINLAAIANTSLEIHIGKISLKNFDYASAFSKRKIVVDQFEIKDPLVSIYQHLGVEDSVSMKQDTVNLKEIFLTNYDTFMVKEVLISNATSTFYQVTETQDTLEIFSVSHISYQITDIVANKNTMNTMPYAAYGEFKLHSRDISVKIKDKASLQIKSVDFESKSHQLDITGIVLTPLLKPIDFFKQLKYRKSWIKLEVKKIAININFESWLISHQVLINDLILSKPVLEIHSNAKIPFAPGTVKPMLGTLLTSLPIDYRVNHILVNDALIKLIITGKNNPSPGNLTFNDMNIEAKNLTNISEYLDSNKYFSINANTRINKTGNVNAKIKIDLASPKSTTRFIVDGKNLNLKKFNTVLEPILLVGIREGKMKSLKINSTFNSNSASGSMDAHYENLRLVFKNKDITHESSFFLKMATGLANGVVKNDNIPNQNNYRTGKFSFNKEPTDSFFKMLWLVTLNGLEDSIIGSDKRDNRQAKKAAKTKSTKKPSSTKTKKKKWKK